jgi:hypothetical protein
MRQQSGLTNEIGYSGSAYDISRSDRSCSKGGDLMRWCSQAGPIAATVFLVSLSLPNHQSPAETSAPNAGAAAPQTGAILLTVFLRHDQSKTVDQINQHLKQTGWYDKFPPDGVEVVSWYVMMGIGQVVTLSVPPDKLRETNRVIEQSAWGGYRTEFYATYDYKPVWDAIPHHRP